MLRNALYLLLAVLTTSLSACAYGYRAEKPVIVSDGYCIKNELYLPDGYRPGIRYPGVVLNHGGWHGIEFATRLWAKILARKGYAVILPQFRGQDGSEGHFEFAKGEVDDCLASLQYLKGQDYVDKDRLAMVGYSLGGLVTLRAAETAPELKAVVLIAAISDPVDFLEEQLKGKPEKERAGMEQHIKDAQERSPLKGLANIDAPVLILHGRLDRRVPFGQSVRLCDTLKAMGKDARLLLYPVAGHGIMWHGEAVDDVTAFLDRHLK